MILQLVQTYITSKTKPTFRWLGLEGKTQENQHSGKTCIEQTLNSNAKESERKMFGTDITNIVKRNKVDLFVKRDIEENSNIQSKQDNHSWQAKPEKKDAKETSSCPQFGPSDPAYMIKAKQPEKKVHDWESLAVYHRPLYQNQGNICKEFRTGSGLNPHFFVIFSFFNNIMLCSK